MRTTWGLATDRGRVREINEDAILAQPPIFLVADGMGGYDAGDRASQIVVDSFRTLAEQGSVSTAEVHSQFELATAQLREMLETEKRAGSTVAGAAVVNQDGVDYWLIFNIGDSRVYSWHEGRLKQISVDHSVVQELIEAGVINDSQAAHHPQRHQVTRALATHVAPDPDYWLIPFHAATRILICSDGLTNEVADPEIARTLQTHEDAQDAADSLIASALSAGGRDNVSVVVVDLLPRHDGGNGERSTTNGVAATANTALKNQFEGSTIPRGFGRKT